MIPKLLRSFLAIIVLMAQLSFGSNAFAAAPPQFGMDFGLTVHTMNAEQGVPKLKGLQILKNYFPGSDLDVLEQNPTGFMSQKEFIILFEKMRLESEGKRTRLTDDELYEKTWLKVRRNNWLPETKLTFGTLKEFFYRYQVSELHGDIPYREGLVLDVSEINEKQFASLYGVREIKSGLFEEILRLKALGVLDKKDRKTLDSISSYYEAFKGLEDDLRLARHPFSQIPDLPQDMRQAVLNNDLNEVLSSLTYNYSTNDANRIHNLVNGTMKLSGQLYEPGDLIDVTKELSRDGWGIYKYGWVIFQGEAAWQFGGGLCGATTMAFTPSWLAGLDVVQRHPHSVYYSNLYPEESFGIDAAIYRGAKNLVLRNSTDDPILFYAVNDDEKQEITMYLIGNSPYINIQVEGPIQVSRNTYKLIRRMHRLDGTVVEDELISKYGAIL